MKIRTQTLLGPLLAALLVILPLAASAEHHQAKDNKIRGMAVQMEAVVTAIDLETREVSLRGPRGNTVTLTAKDQMIKLEDVKLGDILVATYLEALEAELRSPTAEELAEPWLVLEQAAMSGEGEQPGLGGAQIIRAVCTIEGLNRVLGTATIMDSRGKLHIIGDVEPEKMEGVTLGQTVVMVYTQAMALTLEQKSAAQ